MIEHITVVCTGRGHHERTHLAPFTFTGTTWVLAADADPKSVTPPNRALHNLREGRLTLRTPQRSEHSWIFYCARCGRHPRVDADTWRERLPEIARAGLSEIDVSLLPF